ncbi:hypothetical protein M011DRAFT_412342 [Sporormia fimetaria CBS 119925]|uniref:Heterokaryon incompatibility domain-containing protein n=1 Tax=Sporormia fimetaria CBS 119925 TaxID=1340428 RepID=A0A6A6UWS7_9PLEO|nr:hypothetical protein M011DRAFT_412342 [Sporormia fimetaria CBS 119925]
MPHESSPETRSIAYTRRYVQEIRSRIHRRRVFLTGDGHLGTGPEDLREGDVLCGMMGAEVPLALRENGSGQYSVVGETYVDGCMDGEVVEKGLAMREVYLV